MAKKIRLFSKKSIPYAKINAAPPDLPVQPEPPRVHIAVLGSPGVGKTSIIRQFMFSHFSERHTPTQRTQCYYPSLIINDKLYDVTITDCPSLPGHLTRPVIERSDFFSHQCGGPKSSHHHHHHNNTTAYVLVFDVSDADSFAYIETIREQIILQQQQQHPTGKSRSSSGSSPQILVVGNKHDVRQAGGGGGGTGGGGVGGAGGVSTWPQSEDFSSVVRCHWKCPYVESSAKSNWHIMLIFKELMKLIDLNDHKQQHKTPRSFSHLRHHHHHSKHDDKRCTIL